MGTNRITKPTKMDWKKCVGTNGDTMERCVVNLLNNTVQFKESFCLHAEERRQWVHRLEKLWIMRNNNWMKLTEIIFNPRRPCKNDSDTVQQCVIELPEKTMRFNKSIGVNVGVWGQGVLWRNTLRQRWNDSDKKTTKEWRWHRGSGAEMMGGDGENAGTR